MDRELLVGVWSLETCIGRDASGAPIHPLGDRPDGYLIYTDSGHMSATLARAGRPLFRSTDRLTATDAELRAVFEAFDAYAGTYEVDAAASEVPQRTFIEKRIQTMKFLLTAALIALTMPAHPAHAAKKMIVCRDANGNSYFTDVSCPADASREGLRNAPEAQTYNGQQSIDTNLLNNYERPVGSGTTWQWVTKPAPAAAGR